MRLVVIGDIHLYDLAFRPWRLLGKRLLGQTNLWLNRRHVFNRSLIGPVLDHALSLDPDWVIFTGDLTTTALTSEFAMARQALAPALSRNGVVVVPGNHDRYTFTATRRHVFEQFMGAAAPKADGYPHVVEISDQWRLIALNSACPRVMSSRGRVGAGQLQKLGQIVRLGREDGLHKGLVVVCHYPTDLPPEQAPRHGHALADARELKAVLREARGPLLYLHGHVHRPWQWRPSGWQPTDCRMVNAGSPCMVSASYPTGQGFWQIDLPEHPSNHAPNAPLTTGDIILRAHRPRPSTPEDQGNSGSDPGAHGLHWDSLVVNSPRE